jgi:hypothetical protein
MGNLMVLSPMAVRLMVEGPKMTSATDIPLLDGIGDTITIIGTFFVDGFEAISGVFWASATSSPTFVGWLVIISIGASIISGILATVFGLISKIKIGRGRR